MSETIKIESTGTLHRVRDPEGASYRFVAPNNEVSAVIFREGNILDCEEVVRYKNVKFKLVIEINDDDKEYGIENLQE